MRPTSRKDAGSGTKVAEEDCHENIGISKFSELLFVRNEKAKCKSLFALAKLSKIYRVKLFDLPGAAGVDTPSLQVIRTALIILHPSSVSLMMHWDSQHGCSQTSRIGERCGASICACRR